MIKEQTVKEYREEGWVSSVREEVTIFSGLISPGKPYMGMVKALLQ